MRATSLFLGIVSIIAAFIPGYSLGALIPGVVGLLFGAIDYKQSEKLERHKALPIVGIVTSLIGIALGVLFHAFCLGVYEVVDKIQT
ncbi:MAG: hypothetical protein GY754_30250 [bacterium]|nr:hypothetical protein [bacterium]